MKKSAEYKDYIFPHYNKEYWDQIKPIFIQLANKSLLESKEILKAFEFILDLNPAIENGQDLDNLAYFLSKNHLFDTPTQLYTEIFPFMGELALSVESQFTEGCKFLEKEEGNCLELRKSQVSSLLAHIFFCSLLPQPERDKNIDNIYALLTKRTQIGFEKLHFLMNYFKSIYLSSQIKDEEDVEDIIRIRRIVMSKEEYISLDHEYWITNKCQLIIPTIDTKSNIYEYNDYLQIDFANSLIGGGTLSTGAAQEEILFLTIPELLISCILTERMSDREAIYISGMSKYSKYSGYHDLVQFEGNAENPNPLQICGMDALCYSYHEQPEQFIEEDIIRELNKCVIGFSACDENNMKGIATGKWGCGAYSGNSMIKFMVQWLAASIHPPIGKFVFCSCDDPLFHQVQTLIHLWEGRTVGDIYLIFMQYAKLYLTGLHQGITLFHYLADSI